MNMSILPPESGELSALRDCSKLFSPAHVLGMAVILAVTALACQYGGFHSLMVYDGAYFIKSKEPIFAQHDVWRLISIVPVRPLFLLSFYFNYLITGMDPFFFRVTNALIVAATGLGLTMLAALLFELPHLRVPGTLQTRRGVSFLLGLLFVVHPLQTFVVLYDWQREAIMACLFYYWGLAAYVATRSGRIRNTAAGYFVTSVLFLLGMLSKENVATFPLALGLCECVLFPQPLQATFKKILAAAAVVAPAAVLYWVLTQALHRSDSELVQGILARLIDHYHQGGLSFLEVALTEARVFFSYVGMMLFPFVRDVEFMRAETLSRSLLDPPLTAAALAGVIALLSVALACLRKMPLVAFGLLFMMLSLAPESLMIPQYLFFGYRAILPMAGLLLVIGYGLIVGVDRLGRLLPARLLARALVTAALVPVIVLSGVTVSRARHWNHISFWTDLVEKLPPYSRNVETVPFLDISVNCMSTLLSQERYAEAIDIFKKRLAVNATGQPTDKPQDDIEKAIEIFTQTFNGQNMRIGGALISLGVALQISGKDRDAIVAYRKAVEIEPHHTDVHLTLGALLENLGEISEAITHYEQAIKIDPGSALAYNCLGNALTKSGDLARAMQEFSAATQVAPGEVPGYLNLGNAFQEAGYYREAVDEYRKALAVDPRSAEAHHKLGRAMAETGNLPDALNHYRQALALDPGLAAARGDLGLALEYSGQVSEAIDEYEQAAKADPQSAMFQLLLGRAFMAKGRWNDAVGTLTRATHLAPDMAVAFQSLGMALEKCGRIPSALEMLRKAVALDPGLSEAYADLGRLLLHSGDLSEAADKLRTAIELNPGDALAYVSLGRVLERGDNFSLAQEQYRVAVQLMPDCVEAHYRLANNLLREGKALDAVKEYTQVLKLKPDLAQAHANMALALLHGGKIPEAIVTLGRALSLKGDKAEIWYALGRAFAEMKKDREAITYFEKAANLRRASGEDKADSDILGNDGTLDSTK
jgi:protein O-mannosyl-transferase